MLAAVRERALSGHGAESIDGRAGRAPFSVSAAVRRSSSPSFAGAARNLLDSVQGFVSLRRLQVPVVSAVHGAMAGYTRFLVGNINTRLAMLPLDLVVNRRNIVAIRDRMWTRLLFSTGQPPFDAVVTSDDECDEPRRALQVLQLDGVSKLLECPGLQSETNLDSGAADAMEQLTDPLAAVRRLVYLEQKRLQVDQLATGRSILHP